MNMRKIGLCSISTNHRAKEHIARASAIIESIGIECFSFFVDERCDESADIVVALGGDGTILRSKKYAKQHGVNQNFYFCFYVLIHLKLLPPNLRLCL